METKKKKAIKELWILLTVILALLIMLRYWAGRMIGISFWNFDHISYAYSFWVLVIWSIVDIFLFVIMIKK